MEIARQIRQMANIPGYFRHAELTALGSDFDKTIRATDESRSFDAGLKHPWNEQDAADCGNGDILSWITETMRLPLELSEIPL